MDLDNIKIPLKTVVAVGLWVASMVGLYYTMDFKIQSLEEKTSKFEKVIEKNNPELLELKITNLEKEVTKLNGKADQIYDALQSNH
jgi:TolA-binding protein